MSGQGSGFSSISSEFEILFKTNVHCLVFAGKGNNMSANETNIDLQVEDMGFYINYYGFIALLMCVNLPGNILVMMKILRHHDMQINSNLLLVNQAVWDLLCGILYPVFNLAQITTLSSVVDTFGLYALYICFVAIFVVCCFHLNYIVTNIVNFFLLWDSCAVAKFNTEPILHIIIPDAIIFCCFQALVRIKVRTFWPQRSYIFG